MFKTVFLALISFALFLAGEFYALKSTRLIEEPDGGVFTFQCESDPLTNLENHNLNVRRVDGNSSYDESVIYTRRNGIETPSPLYTNRVLLIKEDLRRGLMTIKIQSVQQSDSGRYRCYISSLHTACFYDAVVQEKQNWTKENDTSTTTTLTEEMPDADNATEKHHRYYYVLIPVFALLMAAVFLMLFMKRIRKRCQRMTEAKDSEPETQGINAKEGDEEEQLKNRQQ